MRATVVLDNLLEKTSFLNTIASSKPPLPILSGVLIEAKRGRLIFSATDLEIGAMIETTASVEEEGRVVVPAGPFLETLSNLREEKTTLENKETLLLVTGKKTKASFVTMDEAEFPKLFDEKGEEALDLKKEEADKEMARVVFAASTDAGRPALSAVMLREDKEALLMVATDSHRLSLNKTPSVKLKTALSKKQFLIPSKIIKLIVSQKGGGEIRAFVLEKNNQIVFSLGDTTLVGRLIDAEFPDFEKIIPEEHSVRAEFERTEFLSALKVASVFARDNANIVKLALKKDSLSISSKSQNMGEDTVEVEAKVTGEENEIAFNARFLSELLQNISEDRIVFEMQGPLNPGVFKIADNPNFIHLIMPIRVSEEG